MRDKAGVLASLPLAAAALILILSAPSSAQVQVDALIYKTWETNYSTCLTLCNQHDLVPGVTFAWSKANYIDAAGLAGKDVVMYPGGTGSDQVENSDNEAVLSFIAGGGGFYGTCGGAQTAKLLNLMPGVVQEGTSVSMKVNVRLSRWATRILGHGGEMILSLYNGPGQYIARGDIFAGLDVWHANHLADGTVRVGRANITEENFYWPVKWDAADDGEMFMQSSAAFYGRGRVVVHGAHPELSLRYPRRVCAAVAWAAGHDGLLGDYLLGQDSRHHSDTRSRAAEKLICQREHVSAAGEIGSISFHVGSATQPQRNRALVGVYAGAEQPRELLAQSEVAAIDGAGWHRVELQQPLRVEQGQQVWLALVLEDATRPLYYSRFPDLLGQTFERRAWESPLAWSDLGGGRLHDLSSAAGQTRDFLLSLYATVAFTDPIAHISAEPYLRGCAPLEVKFDAGGSVGSKPSIPVVAYRWTFGDGAWCDRRECTHTYEAAGAYHATLTVTDSDGKSDTQSKTMHVAQCIDGLSAYWKFDEGAGVRAYDSSGNDNSGVFKWRQGGSDSGFRSWPPAGPTWVAGKAGTALAFPALPSDLRNYLSIGHHQSLDLGRSDFSVNAWIFPEGLEEVNGWLSKHHWDGNTRKSSYYQFQFGGDGYWKFQFTYCLDDTNYHRVRSPRLHLRPQTWQMLTCVIERAANTMTVYVDGDPVEVLTFEANISGVDLSNPGEVYLGTSRPGPSFAGMLDEVRIYKRALTPEEVGQLYQSPLEPDGGEPDGGAAADQDLPDGSQPGGDDHDGGIRDDQDPGDTGDGGADSVEEDRPGAEREPEPLVTGGGCTCGSGAAGATGFAAVILALATLPRRRRRWR